MRIAEPRVLRREAQPFLELPLGRIVAAHGMQRFGEVAVEACIRRSGLRGGAIEGHRLRAGPDAEGSGSGASLLPRGPIIEGAPLQLFYACEVGQQTKVLTRGHLTNAWIDRQRRPTVSVGLLRMA